VAHDRHAPHLRRRHSPKIVSMDRLVGEDFEKRLARMKSAAGSA
jgi:hypothetical protein